LASAPRSGRGGREFKSPHPDQCCSRVASAEAARCACHVRSGRMDFADLQDVIERTYGERDRARGVPATVAWLAEEVGELAQAVRKGSREQQAHEFGDVVAWVVTLANQQGIDLNEAVQRYADGCPRCASLPCACP
jgi:NTP pyrophosphatase (non-canonical NTP hydrolase)